MKWRLSPCSLARSLVFSGITLSVYGRWNSLSIIILNWSFFFFFFFYPFIWWHSLKENALWRGRKKKKRISSIDPFAELRSPVGSRVALPGRGLVGVLFMLGRSRTKCCFHASSTTSSSVEYSHTDTKEKSASSKTTTTFSRSFNTEPGKRKSNLDLINGGRYVEPAAAHIIYSTRRDKSAGIRASLFISPQVFYCLVVQHVWRLKLISNKKEKNKMTTTRRRRKEKKRKGCAHTWEKILNLIDLATLLINL